MLTPRVDPGMLVRGLERTFIPPDHFGDVLVDVAWSCRLLRCDEAGIDALLDAGLPRFGARGGSFRRSDILNVGLHSGSGQTIPEIAEAHRVRFSAGPRRSWIETRSWEISFDLRCVRDCGCGLWSLHPPSPERYGGSVRGWPTMPLRSNTPLRLTADVVLRGRENEIGPAEARTLFIELVNDLVHRRILYQYLPPDLRRDPETAAAHGVLDCMAASLLLARRCRDLGLPCRTRKGLLLGSAAVEHVWVEVPAADRGWVPLDPVLAALVSRSGRGGEFVEFACGSHTNRLLPWDLEAEQELLSHLCPDHVAPCRADDLLTTVSARPSDG